MKNIKVNAIANLMLRVLNIVFPLITGPYIARILSKTDYGYFNITNTFIGLFIPFATLGIYNYGIRAISKVKSDKDAINRTFSLLFYISLVCTLVTTLAYFLITFSMEGTPLLKTLYYVMAIQVFAQFLNIEWMNEAFENYTFILYKTLAIRILMLVSIFAFVRSEHDIVAYALVMSLVTMINYLASFLWIKREVKFVKVSMLEVKRVIQPLIAILLLANAGMLYTYLDRMFLSAVALPEDVSYYTIAQTLVFSIAGVVSGAISVSVPRLGYYLGINDYKAYDELVNKGGRIFMFCIIPISFGLAVLGPHATILYAGERYLDAGTSVILFALRSTPWALALILENQIIFVQGYENRLTVIYFIGGGINLALNSLLAYNHIANPAYYIVTTIIAELVVITLDMMLIRRNNLFRMRKLLIHTGKYMLYASGFFVIAYLISVIHPIEWIVNGALLVNILATIVSCVIYYIVVLALVKDEIFISSLQAIKNKVFKKKG